jgi:hypothetical protein
MKLFKKKLHPPKTPLFGGGGKIIKCPLSGLSLKNDSTSKIFIFCKIMRYFENLPLNPTAYSEMKMYFDFLELYGSHVIDTITTGIEYGSEYTATSDETSGQIKSMEDQCASASMSGSASLLGISASASMGSCKSKAKGENRYSGSSTTNQIHTVPVKYIFFLNIILKSEIFVIISCFLNLRIFTIA